MPLEQFMAKWNLDRAQIAVLLNREPRTIRGWINERELPTDVDSLLTAYDSILTLLFSDSLALAIADIQQNHPLLYQLYLDSIAEN
jgi:hypothetical protein